MRKPFLIHSNGGNFFYLYRPFLLDHFSDLTRRGPGDGGHRDGGHRDGGPGDDAGPGDGGPRDEEFEDGTEWLNEQERSRYRTVPYLL
jgi:hypothetical protein